MFTLPLFQLGIVFVAALLYAILISTPILESLDDARETRWIVTAFGVALVIVTSTHNGPRTWLDLLVAFGVAAVPYIVRGAWYGYRDRERAAIDAARRAGIGGDRNAQTPAA